MLESLLAATLDLILPWLRALGFAVSIPECQFCVFTLSRLNLADVSFTVEDCVLSCLSEVKYLGVILDRWLTWTPHVRMIAERAIRSICVIHVLARDSWGANSSLLLIAYRNLVHSLLEWYSPLFASASGRVLLTLDRMQFMAFRVILSCMSSTLTSIFLAESGASPLSWCAVSLPIVSSLGITHGDVTCSPQSFRFWRRYLQLVLWDPELPVLPFWGLSGGSEIFFQWCIIRNDRSTSTGLAALLWRPSGQLNGRKFF